MPLLNALLGQELFLAGKYLSLGINGSGTLGTKTNAPIGVTTDAVNGYFRLGMVADVDGFGVGKVATRDVMLAGTPVETFSLGYKAGGVRYVKTNSERDGVVQIANGTVSNLSTATVAKAGWVGTTTEGVKVSQVMSLSDDAKFVRVDVTLTNQSASTLSELRYMRSIDPDHGSSFSTKNVIIEQGGDTVGGAAVAAYASSTNVNPFFYYTPDERAVVSTFGFENRDPYAAAAYDAKQAKGYTVTGDVAVNIDFSVGSLAAGGSTTVTFYMGVTDNLTTTIAAINAGNGVTPPPPNSAPVAVADTLTLIAGTSATGNVLANDTDANKDVLNATLKTGPANGTVTIASNGAYTYTPTANFFGSDTFTYNVSDGMASAVGTVTISVTPPPPPPNNAPVAVSDTLTVASGVTGSGNVLANDTDANNDVLRATLQTGPANGTVTVAVDGSFIYTSTANFSGSDTFTYNVSDGVASAVGTVSITVTPPPPPPNDAPVAIGDSLTVAAGASGTGNVLANDTDANGDALQASLKTGPANGSVTIAGNGAFVYTPNANFFGSDTFSYNVSDGVASAVGTVTVTVTAPPPPPPPPSGDPLLTRSGTIDLSSTENQVVVAADGRNTVYVDSAAISGADRVTGFAGNDVFVTSAKLYDGNGDGLIGLRTNRLAIDAPLGTDTVDLIGVATLRYLGQADGGLFVYANASTRRGFTEGTVKDNLLKGDVGDLKANTFLFDTALGIDLGHDTITNFGRKDIIVTTSALTDSDRNGIIAFGSDGRVELNSAGGGGDLALFGMTAGSAITSLELDGTFSQGGVDYFVYSNVGSNAGAGLVGV